MAQKHCEAIKALTFKALSLSKFFQQAHFDPLIIIANTQDKLIKCALTAGGKRGKVNKQNPYYTSAKDRSLKTVTVSTTHIHTKTAAAHVQSCAQCTEVKGMN